MEHSVQSQYLYFAINHFKKILDLAFIIIATISGNDTFKLSL